MANQIKLKRGLQKNLPSNLSEGEIVITTDTNKLYGKGFCSFKKGDDINGSDKLWNFIWVSE